MKNNWLPTDGRTDIPSYRDARTHLKTWKLSNAIFPNLAIWLSWNPKSPFRQLSQPFTRVENSFHFQLSSLLDMTTTTRKPLSFPLTPPPLRLRLHPTHLLSSPSLPPGWLAFLPPLLPPLLPQLPPSGREFRQSVSLFASFLSRVCLNVRPWKKGVFERFYRWITPISISISIPSSISISISVYVYPFAEQYSFRSIEIHLWAH